MGMFQLMTTNEENGDDVMETRGDYETLDDAIEAAVKANLDLNAAMIEKDGGQHSVNGWMMVRIAGGDCKG